MGVWDEHSDCPLRGSPLKESPIPDNTLNVKWTSSLSLCFTSFPKTCQTWAPEKTVSLLTDSLYSIHAEAGGYRGLAWGVPLTQAGKRKNSEDEELVAELCLRWCVCHFDLPQAVAWMCSPEFMSWKLNPNVTTQRGGTLEMIRAWRLSPHEWIHAIVRRVGFSQSNVFGLLLPPLLPQQRPLSCSGISQSPDL